MLKYNIIMTEAFRGLLQFLEAHDGIGPELRPRPLTPTNPFEFLYDPSICRKMLSMRGRCSSQILQTQIQLGGECGTRDSPGACTATSKAEQSCGKHAHLDGNWLKFFIY
jgi:hypothetical protein